MKSKMMAFLPFLVGILVWVCAGTEAALIWFMAFYLLRSIHLFLLNRQREPARPIIDDNVIRIIGLDQDDWKA